MPKPSPVVSHYDVVGVPADASAEEIKRAYYERARLYHPDAHASSSVAVRAEAERTMQALNQSWTILRDAGRRRRYDRVLARHAEEGWSVFAGAPAGMAATATSPRGGGGATLLRPSVIRGRGTRYDDPRRTSRPVPERPRRAELGSGFQYWCGTSGRSGVRGLNLRVSGASLTPLRRLVPDGLVALHAEHTTIGDVDLRNLLGMRSLRLLDLTGTAVTDAGLVHLLGCEKLEVLSLWDTAITDDGVSLLARLPALCHLGLGNTSVTDAGLRHVANLRRLRLLQLSGTSVEGPGLRHLHGLPELTSVSLPWKVRGRHRRRLRRALPRASVLI